MLKPRPLAPHLTIYQAQLSSVFSVFHRITGGFLGFFLLLTFLLFPFLASIDLSLIYGSIGQSIWNRIEEPLIFLFLLSTSYHLINGIRHLIWDTGIGLEKSKLKTSVILVILGSLIFLLGAII